MYVYFRLYRTITCTSNNLVGEVADVDGGLRCHCILELPINPFVPLI
jgi:hypothetical protein